MTVFLIISAFSALFSQSVSGQIAEPCRATGERYFVTDIQQCDRFHMCDDDGFAEEFLCEDGLVFETISKQCVMPFKVGCEESGRVVMQEPQPSGNCPRQNGKWAVDDTCNQYIDCSTGIERLVTCQNHLVYDDSTGNCEHPDSANRVGCTAEELYGFSCPSSVGQGRYAAEGDCRAFFTCATYTNYHPRLGGCPEPTVFNGVRQICDEPENVPACIDYYTNQEN